MRSCRSPPRGNGQSITPFLFFSSPDASFAALTVCSNYLSHVLAKLDDNSVPVKKAAIKAIRQYPQMIANNTFALQRLTRCAP